MKMHRFNLLFIILIVCPFSFMMGNDYPHILVHDDDKSVVLDKIEKERWAHSIFEKVQKRLAVYVERHKTDPNWILGRYLMNRVPGKRYTHFVSDREGTRLVEYKGDAPVATVRVASHKRVPITPEGKPYVVPNVDRKSLSRYVKNAPVRILSNTRQMQAVECQDGKLLYAVCYEAGRLDCGKGNSIEMNTPGLYMAHFDMRGKIRSLAVSDPTRKLPSMRLSVKGHCFPVDKALLSSCEYNALSDVTEMVVRMPQAEYAGRSVVIEFEAKK